MALGKTLKLNFQRNLTLFKKVFIQKNRSDTPSSHVPHGRITRYEKIKLKDCLIEHTTERGLDQNINKTKLWIWTKR